MAKKSSIEKNARRAKLTKQMTPRRIRLKAIARDRDAAPEDRFEAQLKLSEMPRNSSATRLRNRCSLTGGRAAFTASSSCRVSRCANSPRPARSRACSSRAGEGTLSHVDERSPRRYADPHPQRTAGAPRRGRGAGVQFARQCLEVLKREAISGALRASSCPGIAELKIELKYVDGEPVIREIARCQNPAARLFKAGRSAAVYNGLASRSCRPRTGHVGQRSPRRKSAARCCAGCSEETAMSRIGKNPVPIPPE